MLSYKKNICENDTKIANGTSNVKPHNAIDTARIMLKNRNYENYMDMYEKEPYLECVNNVNNSNYSIKKN
jgi:hypothetical protein